jgi:hypothetical protein
MVIKTIVHIDIGLSPQLARVLGESPSIDHLCGDQTGDSIRDNPEAIAAVGGYPAAVTCGRCKRIAELMNDGLSIRQARVDSEPAIIVEADVVSS